MVSTIVWATQSVILYANYLLTQTHFDIICMTG